MCLSCGVSGPVERADTRSCKPEAPLTLAMTTEAVAPNRFEVVVTATPTEDAKALSIRLFASPASARVSSRDIRFENLRAHVPREFRTRVELEGEGAELTASARLQTDVGTLGKMQSIPIGSPAAKKPQPIRVIHTADGDVLEEVMP
jgi:hypothetical protein